MGRRKLELHTIVLRLAAVLLSLVLITTGMVSGRYARYVTSASGSDSARVAKFTVTQSILQRETDLAQTISIPEIKPGETVIIDVVVEHDTEVAVRNTVDVQSLYSNLPLTISVQEKGTDTSGSSIFTAAYGPGTFKKEYEAAITWGRGSNDLDHIGMVDLIIITVTSEQVD